MSRSLAFVLLLAFAPLSTVAAATLEPLATVTGHITGPDGARLPGVTITIVNGQTGDRVVLVADADGGYSASIGAGTLEIHVQIDGFRPEVASVDAAAGARLEHHFTLALATIEERLDVVGMIPRSVVSTSDLGESAARDVGEAVARMPSMAIIRKGGIANDIVMRGYQGENLTVLIDGARLHGACPNNMDPIVFHADIAEVERVEIGRGPFDVRSQGSLGGVVNVITARPQVGWHALANLAVGSAEFVNASGTASYGSERASILGGYSFRRGMPYEDGSGRAFTSYANYRPDAADSEAFRVGTGWTRGYLSPRAGQSMHLAYTHQQADHVLYPYLQMDGISDTAHRLNGTYEFDADRFRIATASVQAYYSRVSHAMTDEYRQSAAGSARGYSMGSDAETRTIGAKAQATSGDTRFGLELFDREWSVTTAFAMGGYQPQAALPDVRVANAGSFVESASTLARVKIEYGGRLDWSRSRAAPTPANLALYSAYYGDVSTSRADLYPSAKARAIIRATERFTIETGVGHSVRVPDPQERYYALSRMGTDWVGNPSLDPTRNTEIEGGVRVDAGRLRIDATAYSDFLHDFVIVTRASRSMPIASGGAMPNLLARTFANVDARLRGFEATTDYQLGPALFASAGFAYTRGTKTPDPARGITDADLSEIPPLSGRASLRYDRGVWFGEVAALFAAAQDHVDADLREQPTPGYAIGALRGGARAGRLRVTAAIDNLFDKLYTEHLSYQRDPFRTGVIVPSPGRTLSLRATVTW